MFSWFHSLVLSIFVGNSSAWFGLSTYLFARDTSHWWNKRIKIIVSFRVKSRHRRNQAVGCQWPTSNGPSSPCEPGSPVCLESPTDGYVLVKKRWIFPWNITKSHIVGEASQQLSLSCVWSGSCCRCCGCCWWCFSSHFQIPPCRCWDISRFHEMRNPTEHEAWKFVEDLTQTVAINPEASSSSMKCIGQHCILGLGFRRNPWKSINFWSKITYILWFILALFRDWI